MGYGGGDPCVSGVPAAACACVAAAVRGCRTLDTTNAEDAVTGRAVTGHADCSAGAARAALGDGKTLAELARVVDAAEGAERAAMIGAIFVRRASGDDSDSRVANARRSTGEAARALAAVAALGSMGGSLGGRWRTGRSRARSRRWSGWRTRGRNVRADRGITRTTLTGRRRRRRSPPPPGPRRNSPEAPAPRRARRDARRARGRRDVSREGVRGALGARRARVQALRPLRTGRRPSRPRRPRRPREEPQPPHLREEPTEKGIVPPSTSTRSAAPTPAGVLAESGLVAACAVALDPARPGVVAARARLENFEDDFVDADVDAFDVDADADADARASAFDRDVAATTMHAARLLHLPFTHPLPAPGTTAASLAGGRASTVPGDAALRGGGCWLGASHRRASRGRPRGARAAAVAAGAQVEPVRSTVSGSRRVGRRFSAGVTRAAKPGGGSRRLAPCGVAARAAFAAALPSHRPRRACAIASVGC